MPSTGALALFAAYNIATGLLVAEVNINTMCELGSGSTSITTMAGRTLGPGGQRLASATYIFLHYSLLVAYVSRGGEMLAGLDPSGNFPLWAASASLVAALGGMVYAAPPRVLDAVNGVLVVGVVASFVLLLSTVATLVEPATLVDGGNWAAVPATLPVICLAFVYHNVVPVVVSNLEGDVTKVRQAIAAGVMLPFVMFTAWDWAILGSIGSLGRAQQLPTNHTTQQVESNTSDIGLAPEVAL